MDSFKKLFLILGLLGILHPQDLLAQTPEPVVHAVLFYSPTCAHCHQVITENLMPLQDQYGSRLVILGMDTTLPWASGLYWEAIRHYGIPQADWAVPFLVVGEEVLIGGNAIPDRFPTIIEEGLAAGGIDLPNYPALVTFLQEEELLDPRYPDRLIAHQAQPPEGEEPPPPQDSVAAGAPAPTGDSAVVADSTDAGEPAVGDAPTEALVSAGDTAAVQELAVGSPEDSTEVLPPGDSAVGVRDSESSPVGPEAGFEDPEPEETRETEAPGPESDSAVPPSPPLDSPTSEGPDSGAETLGTFGLAEAAREMESMTMWDRFNLDPTGNSISVLVLLGMVVSLTLRGYPPRVKGGEWPVWVIPTLVLVGAVVAAYLTFIEVTHTEAVCGPVGDCNTVNQSKYAFLFGFLPIGVLGLVGYGLIMALWVLGRSGSGNTPRMAALGIWGAALFGTLFSVYLTFLEPFVIGATCAWCLTSAVVMTLLLWATGPVAARVWPTDDTALSSD